MIAVVRLAVITALVALGGSTTAVADPPVDDADPIDINLDFRLSRARKPLSLSRHMTDKLTLWSNEIGGHLSLLTLDLVDMRFDVRRRHAALRLGALSPDVGLRLDSAIIVRGNVARVNASLALAVAGRRLELEIPTFEVVTQNVRGERSVEVRVPLIEGRF